VTTGVDVGLIESSHSFDGSHKTGIVLLRHHVLHYSGIGESVQDPRSEVSPKAVPGRKVQHEVGWREGSGLYTTTSRAASDVQTILFRGRLDVVTITTETSIWVEDGSLEDLRRVRVFRLRVLRPVPIPANRSAQDPLKKLNAPKTYGWPPVYPHSSRNAFS
jgi:hypothetical protein